MNNRIFRIIRITAVITLALFLFFNLLPAPPRTLPTPKVATNPAAADEEPHVSLKDKKSYSPEELAGSFGWRKPAALEKTVITPAPAAALAPEYTKMLVPMQGTYIERETQKRYWFFKDTRTNKILKLTPGVPEKGWTLLKVLESGEFLLQYNGKQYIVK